MSNPNARRLRHAWLAGALCLVFSSVAEARTENLRWTHPNPGEVQAFRVHLGAAPRSYTQTINIGLPTPDAAGVYTYSLQVPDGAVLFVAITAVGTTQLQSGFSNEQVRRPATSGGDGTTGGGTGGTTGSGGDSQDSLGRPGKPVLVPGN